MAVSTEIRTDICSDFAAPTITEPAPFSTDESSVVVKGTGEPAMAVVIKDNSADVGSTVVGGDGTYALMVPLSVGDNMLIADISNTCQTKQSSSVTVHRNAPPTPPTPPAPLPSPPGTNTGSGGASASPGQGQSPLPPTNTSPSSAPHIGKPLPPTPQTPGYMRPTIVRPHDRETFLHRTVWVTGRAAPFSTVVVYVNGIAVAKVVAGEDGTYGANVQLHRGTNTIQVRAALGDKTALSEKITVYFNPAVKEPGFWSGWIWWLIIFLLLLAIFILLFILWRRRKRKEEEAQ